MTKFIRLLFLSMVLLFSSLMATDATFVEPEVALKKISNNAIEFIMAEKSNVAIIGSQEIESKRLDESDILGHLPCAPLYSCPETIQQYLENLGIKNDQELILYDNSYGVYASTLYMVLESIGHKNIRILNGGVNAIEKLDPNKRIYDKYYTELMDIGTLVQKEDNSTSMKEIAVKTLELEEKLSVLKPFLLVKESTTAEKRTKNSTYKIKKEKFNFNFLASRDDLQKAVEKVRKEGRESNISIIDVCSMMDIVGSQYGTSTSKVKSVDWKELIDQTTNGVQSKDVLEKIFAEAGLNKENRQYVYCMSGSPRAFYVAVALRSVGYDRVKAFIGDWNVWIGDAIE